ncbi:ribosome maturation factor RimP [Jatrophihabitans endophyticus]|uniref:Ribosome maturation factor RimP n=1 Tax=Jatrophihabitans endophyticus TaxID=1206085 RepID=A0A1M5MER8_9ACTN|nr:ribosome maturation factor RimP [Jatrophihabitans endophyticus]SHG75820.1 ribosome maturation factor RimP [Jatrophihabitans endophyticus]
MPPASAGASGAQVRQSLLDLLDPLVRETGHDLEDVSVARAGRRSIVRVVVDADGGIDLDAVAEVSRVVSDALDAALQAGPDGDPEVARALAGSYTLEVTSPGVDRPLTEPRHWRRAVGRLVATEAHGKQVTGRVVTTDDAGATLDVKGRQQSVPWAALGRGKVQVEFNRPAEKE